MGTIEVDQSKPPLTLEDEFTSAVKEQRRLLIYNRFLYWLATRNPKSDNEYIERVRAEKGGQLEIGLRSSSWVQWLAYWSFIILLSMLVFVQIPIGAAFLTAGVAVIFTLAPAFFVTKQRQAEVDTYK